MTDHYHKAEFKYIGDMECRHYELYDYEIDRLLAEGELLLAESHSKEWADNNREQD
jgi:hypothetical protein